uniref:GDP-D-glucose phosphorylase 1 n=1 Tax=Steinernema glaseri TaxID=37863 RepID=A0A1I7Y4P4_9BILA
MSTLHKVFGPSRGLPMMCGSKSGFSTNPVVLRCFGRSWASFNPLGPYPGVFGSEAITCSISGLFRSFSWAKGRSMNAFDVALSTTWPLGGHRVHLRRRTISMQDYFGDTLRIIGPLKESNCLKTTTKTWSRSSAVGVSSPSSLNFIFGLLEKFWHLFDTPGCGSNRRHVVQPLFNLVTLDLRRSNLTLCPLFPVSTSGNPRSDDRMENGKIPVIPIDGQGRTHRSLSSVQIPTGLQEQNPTPFFQYRTSEFIFDLKKPLCNPVENGKSSSPSHSRLPLKEFLASRWEDSKKEKVFNYDLNCMYKLLDGDYNLSIQLNVERGKLRRKPMRFRSISENFNSLRWNFTRLKPEEILMFMRCLDRPFSDDPLDRHVIAVNASPLERSHSLLVPAVNKCLPQSITETAVRMGTDMMLLVDDDSFHVLFNSLLGQASVNHLHMHALFWPYDSDLIFRRYDELARGVYAIRRPDWFISTFAFQLTSVAEFDTFIENVTKCIELLAAQRVAHNVFFTRAPLIRTSGPLRFEERQPSSMLVTAYVFPRRSITGAKPPTNFNPAANELAGCLTSYTYRFFEAVTETTAIRIIEEDAVLEDAHFEMLAREVVASITGQPSSSDEEDSYGERKDSSEQLTSPELDELRDSFHTFELRSPKRFANPGSLHDRSRSYPVLQ